MSRSVAYRNWLLTRNTRGKDPLVDSALDGYIEATVLTEAKELNANPVTKLYVEACLLATTDFDEISEILEIEPYTIQIYHDIYYDVHSLNRVQKVDHISEIADGDESKLKQWSLVNGLDFVKWRLGIIPTLSAKDSLEGLMADAYYRSKEAFFNGNSSVASREARHWSKHASDLAKQLALINIEGEDAGDSLELALSKITEDNNDIVDINDLKDD